MFASMNPLLMRSLSRSDCNIESSAFLALLENDTIAGLSGWSMVIS